MFSWGIRVGSWIAGENLGEMIYGEKLMTNGPTKNRPTQPMAPVPPAPPMKGQSSMISPEPIPGPIPEPIPVPPPGVPGTHKGNAVKIVDSRATSGNGPLYPTEIYIDDLRIELAPTNPIWFNIGDQYNPTSVTLTFYPSRVTITGAEPAS